MSRPFLIVTSKREQPKKTANRGGKKTTGLPWKELTIAPNHYIQQVMPKREVRRAPEWLASWPLTVSSVARTRGGSTLWKGTCLSIYGNRSVEGTQGKRTVSELSE